MESNPTPIYLGDKYLFHTIGTQTCVLYPIKEFTYHREGMFNPDLADMKVGIYDNTVTINMGCFSEREQERLKFILSKIMTLEEASKAYNAVNDFVVGESHFIRDKLIKVGAKSIQFYHNINEGTLTMHIKDPNMKINLN